jgi:hypothetical protein
MRQCESVLSRRAIGSILLSGMAGLASMLAMGGLALAQSPSPTPPPTGDWWARAPVRMTKYYAMKTDLSEADAKALALHMDASFESYMMMFSKLPVRIQRPARLYLYLFADQQDYMTVLPARFGTDGAGSWGKCITRGNEIALVGFRGEYSVEEMKPLLQHEGFHQVASILFPGMPLWVNEGLAEMFERGAMVGNTLALGEYSAHDKARLLKALQGQRIVPFDRFFAVNSAEWGAMVRADSADELYLQAWSMVHYFIFTENRKYERNFLSFLVQLNRRVDWKVAFTTAFGTPDFRAIEQKWLEYIQNTPTTNYRMTTVLLDFLANGLLKLHNKGIHPSSLEELKAKLRDDKFERTVELFGKSIPVSADDDRAFEVPGADGPTKPRFVVIDARGRPIDSRQLRRENTPVGIATTGLGSLTFQAKPLVRAKNVEYVLSAEPTKIGGDAAAARKKKPE